MSDFHRDETRHYKQLPGSRNCMQCAVAYMLGLPLAEVPDFVQAGSEAWEAFYQFFEARGFTAEMFAPNVQIEGDYIASGQTERGTSHMVVMRGGELLHDPHPSNAGLTAVQVVWLIARRAGQTGDAALRRERDELAARLAEIEAQPPVAWIEHELQGTGLRHLHFERRPNRLRDDVVAPVWTELIARPAPTQHVNAADELAPAAAPKRAEPAMYVLRSTVGTTHPTTVTRKSLLSCAQSVYLVAAGLTQDGQELYTRHDAPVPMADNEHLYAAAPERAEPTDIEAVLRNAVDRAVDQCANATGQRAKIATFVNRTDIVNAAIAQIHGDAPTCETKGLLGATSGVGRECDYWAGGVCTSPEPCQHQQPVKPCRTCGPAGGPDSVACPKGGAE